MKRTSGWLTAATIAFALPRVAAPCSPPPDIWTIEHAWPPAGAEDVPTDGLVVVRGESAFGNFSYPFREVLSVEVRRGGAPVPGDVLSGRFHAEAVWRAAEPLAPGTVYEVRLTVENLDDSWFDGEIEGDLERTWTFTTGEGPAGEPAAPTLDAVLAEVWTRELRQCSEESEVGSCGGCLDEVVVGTEDRLRVEARIPRVEGPFGGAYVARLRVAPTEAALADAGPSVAAGFWDRTAARLAVDLGRVDDWPAEGVCVQAEVADPLGRVTSGEARCVAFDDRTGLPDESPETDENSPDEGDGESAEDPPPDADDELSRRRHRGCAATGAPAGGALAGLVLLLGLRRPRHHRARR